MDTTTLLSFLQPSPVSCSTLDVQSSSSIFGNLVAETVLSAPTITCDGEVFSSGSLLDVVNGTANLMSVGTTTFAGSITGTQMAVMSVSTNRITMLSGSHLVVSTFTADDIFNDYAYSETISNGVNATNVMSITVLHGTAMVGSELKIGDCSLTNLLIDTTSNVSVVTLTAQVSNGTIVYTNAIGTITSISNLDSVTQAFQVTADFINTISRIIDEGTTASTFTVLVDGTYELTGLVNIAIGNGTSTTLFSRFTVSDTVGLNLFVNGSITRQLAFLNHSLPQSSITMMIPYYYVGTFSSNDKCVIRAVYNRVLGPLTRLATIPFDAVTLSQNCFYRLGPK